MATAHDVAAFIQARTGGVDRLKLQKLTYYAQAWTLVWDGKKLFDERIEAWAHGPVVPEVWRADRHAPLLPGTTHGRPEALDAREAASVDAIIDFYNAFTGWQLRERTHKEAPWRDARVGLAETEPSSVEVTADSMQRFYSRILSITADAPQRSWDPGDEDVHEVEDVVFEEARRRQVARWHGLLQGKSPSAESANE